VKPSRSALAPAKPSLPPAPPTEGLARSWVRFWFTPADPIGLHVVRLLAGLVFLAWLLPFAGHLDSLFGLQGWFDQQAYAEAGRLPDGPPKPIGWSVLYLAGSDLRLLAAGYWLSVAVLALFTLGMWTRLTAVLTWVIVASFTVNPVLDYDADALLTILAFYLMIGYVLLGQGHKGQSLVSRLVGSRVTWLLGRPSGPGADRPEPSVGANLALRLMQVHFAIVVLTSGLHKLQFGDWWAGVAFWYPLYPPFETTLAAARTHASHGEAYLALLSLAAYATLAWQLAFPLFAWRPRWRPVLLGGAVLGWLGTAFLYRLPLLGPGLLIGCLSYVAGAEWRRLLAGLARLPGLHRLASWLPVLPDERADAGPKRRGAASLVTGGQR
jgi:hypothetical protein